MRTLGIALPSGLICGRLILLLVLPSVVAAGAAAEGTAIWGGKGSGEGAFLEPRDIAVNVQGQVYVADFRNHRIQKFDPRGKFLLAWGGPGTAPGQFKDPTGIAVDPEGAVYVVDTWNHRVQKFSPDGEPLEHFAPEVFAPKGVWVGPDGKIYIVDTGNCRVVVVKADGSLALSFGSRGAGPGQFVEPVGVCLDHGGNIYVSDSGNHRVQVFSSQGLYLREIVLGDVGGENTDSFCEIDGQDRLWVTYPARDAVVVFSPQGERLFWWGGFGRLPGEFEKPSGLALTPDGRVIVADRWNHRLQVCSFETAAALPTPPPPETATTAPPPDDSVRTPPAEAAPPATRQQPRPTPPVPTPRETLPRNNLAILLGGLALLVVAAYVVAYLGVRLYDYAVGTGEE
jgi:DNA-binding beta-propeller fold protein YncE